METNFDLNRTVLVKKQFCVAKNALDASGFKIHINIILELDDSFKQ